MRNEIIHGLFAWEIPETWALAVETGGFEHLWLKTPDLLVAQGQDTARVVLVDGSRPEAVLAVEKLRRGLPAWVLLYVLTADGAAFAGAADLFKAGADSLLPLEMGIEAAAACLRQGLRRANDFAGQVQCEDPAEEHFRFLDSRQQRIGQILNLVAHKWRQPLTIINTLVSNIELRSSMGKLEPEFLRPKLQKISQTVHVLSDTIEDFRGIFSTVGVSVRVRLRQVLDQALLFFNTSLARRKLTIHLEGEGGQEVQPLWAGDLVQAVLELLYFASDRAAPALEGETLPVLFTLADNADFSILHFEFLADRALDQEGYFAVPELEVVRLIVEIRHQGRVYAQKLGNTVSLELHLPKELNDVGGTV